MPPKKRALKRKTSEARAQTTRNVHLPLEEAMEADLGIIRTPLENNAFSKKDKSRQQPLYLTADQQYDVVLWFQEHEFLYDKGHADYKLTERKNALWKEKAEEIGVCDGPRLKCWIDSLRTQYGKLTKRPSGSGGRISDREKWILEKFAFLSRHIYRIPSRRGVDLLSKIREKHPERIQDSQESDEEDENGEDKLPSISPTLSTASGDTDTSIAAKGKKKQAEKNLLLSYSD